MVALAHRRRARTGAPTLAQRGATLVEAAIVTPLLVTLIFAVLEMGLASNDYLGLANAVRAGARTGSSAGSDGTSDFLILAAVGRESTALKRSDIDRIVVFRGSVAGGAPSAACQAGTPTPGVCNVYTPADLARPKTDFGCGTSSPDRYWCPSSRIVTVNGSGTDYLGVWMQMQHRWVTKIFGNARTLTDTTVIRLEPRNR